MAIGREIVNSGIIPTVDTYSFTMLGTPYPSYQMFWLADIGLYAIYNLGGPALVVFIQSILITATYVMLLWICWKICMSWRVAVGATLFAIALGFHNWSVRPQTISYVVGVLFILTIYSYRLRPNRKWLVVFPLGMLVWVNSHGSFVIGLVLIGIWLGDEAWKIIVDRYKKENKFGLDRLWIPLISLGLTLLVCIANPRGLGIVNYVSTLSSNPVVQNIVPEWSPPSFDTIHGAIFLVALLSSATLLALSPKRPDFFQLVTFLVFGALGLRTTRGIIWFGLMMAPVIADHLQSIVSQFNQGKISKRSRKGKPVANLSILIILTITVVISLPWLKGYLPLPSHKVGLLSAETPISATRFLLEKRPPGEIFNEMGYGSYLIWAAQPEYKVFTDPRIELYTQEIWWDYVYLTNVLPGWEEILDRYGISSVMVNPDAQKLFVEALEESGGWSEQYKDQSAVIFVKEASKE